MPASTSVESPTRPYTAVEAAEELKLSVNTIKRLVDRQVLDRVPHIKVWRIPRTQIDRMKVGLPAKPFPSSVKNPERPDRD